MSAYYNDNERFVCNVIESNIMRGRLPQGKVHCENIEKVVPSDLEPFRAIHLFAGIAGAALACRRAGLPDDFSICTFGFPCQDISAIGTGDGLGGAKSSLFFEAVRLLRGLGTARPDWLLVENSPLLRTRGLERVLEELEGAGYTVLESLVVGADDVGAPHQRKRMWIVAYSNRIQWRAKCDVSHVAFERRDTRAELEGRPRAVALGHRAKFDGQRSAEGACCDRQSERPYREPNRAMGFAHSAGLQGFVGTDSAAQRREGTVGYIAAPDLWPLGQGFEQHEWEQPRHVVFESTLGASVDGLSRRLVRPEQQRWNELRKQMTQAVGNAWCPQTAVPILRSILELHQLTLKVGNE